MKKVVIPILLASIFFGCSVAPQKVTISSNFDTDHAAKMMEPGDANLFGNAFLRQNGGGVVTCAGSQVFIVPVTEYSEERMRVLYNSVISGYRPQFGAKAIEFIPEKPEYFKYMQKVVCDSSGNFEFKNVSPGEFYALTVVSWSVGSDKPNQGGSIMKRVSLVSGDNPKLILTP